MQGKTSRFSWQPLFSLSLVGASFDFLAVEHPKDVGVELSHVTTKADQRNIVASLCYYVVSFWDKIRKDGVDPYVQKCNVAV